MKTRSTPRRTFMQTATATLGWLALAGLNSSVRAATPKAVSPELQTIRDKLLAEMEDNRGLAVPKEDGSFLNLVVHVTEAKHVLEVGTFVGYSAIRMGMALEETGGKLTTIEIDSERVKQAKGNFQKAGLSDRITSLEGDAHEVAKSVEGPFDVAFLDAEKGGEMDYFKTIFPKIRPGGFLLLHNAISYKRQMAPYLEMVSKHPQIVHVVLSLSMRDGFSVGFKKKAA